jgi:hypothetical protein
MQTTLVEVSVYVTGNTTMPHTMSKNVARPVEVQPKEHNMVLALGPSNIITTMYDSFDYIAVQYITN